VDCIRCGSGATRRDGQTRLGGQRWRCGDCQRRFTRRSTSAFSGHAFSDDIIALAVRWYVRYRLSYADVAEWLAERGLSVDRGTIYRWVRRFLPLFEEAARAYRRPIGDRWHVDETYCRLQGRWVYAYRAIDQRGQVVDVYVTQRRNAGAAQAFFRRAIAGTGVTPRRIITDKARCYPPALRGLRLTVQHRRSRYLNNRLERDHSFLKQRLRAMRGFKQLPAADVVSRGHALVQNLRSGFSTLTAAVPRELRLATAWPRLASEI
jgi:transposase-like protein